MLMKEITSSLMMFTLCLLFPTIGLCVQEDCCSSILLESDQSEHAVIGERLGFYNQSGYYGARPVYRQQGGNFFIFFEEKQQKWIDSRNIYGDSMFSNILGSSLSSKLVNDMDAHCLEADNNWSFYNGSEMMSSQTLTANCSTVDKYCCQEIIISSPNSQIKTGNQSLYNRDLNESLGNYTAICMNNGRFIYQKENQDRFLEYGERYWLVSKEVKRSGGHFYQPGNGGSVCPEHVGKEWKISEKEKDGDWKFKDDPKMRITCAEKKKITHPEHLKDNHGTSAVAEVVFGFILLILLCMIIALFAMCKVAYVKQMQFDTYIYPIE